MAECHIKKSHRNCSLFDYHRSIHFARDEGYSINKPCALNLRNCSLFDYDRSIHFARDDGYSINKPCAFNLDRCVLFI